ncbi:MAG: replication initiation protein [Candidatus Riflebacteria bacterium]|nr:replication initiation protein [Candidatus Riflebacteria bacterium]
MKHTMVVKSNLLVESSYKLTAQEQWVILTLTSKIRPDDEDFKDYSISIKEFAEMTGVRHKGEYEDVKEITKKLIGRAFTIREASGPLQLSWLSAAKYHEGKGTVSLRFDPGLRPYLLHLKECFTKYSLHFALRLKSSFSIRIYELLKQYEKLGERSFLLSELKDKLGIQEDQYKLYGHFKAKVLIVAQEELTEKTDISFDYEEIKVGRGVGKIRFFIKSQIPKQTTEQLLLSEISDEEIHVEIPQDPSLLKLFEIIPTSFRDKESLRAIIKTSFEKNGFDYVMRNIVYANEKSNAMKPGSNPEKGSNYRVYLAKALHDDYGLAYQEDLASKKESQQTHHRVATETEKKKNQEAATIRIEQEDREKARAFMKSFAQETLKNFEQEAQKRLSPDALKRYQRGDVIGLFEFKRKMENVVMEHMGIRKPPAAEPHVEEAGGRPGPTSENRE